MNFTYLLFSLIKLLGGRSKIRRSKFTTDSSNTIREVCKLFKFSYVLIYRHVLFTMHINDKFARADRHQMDYY